MRHFFFFCLVFSLSVCASIAEAAGKKGTGVARFDPVVERAVGFLMKDGMKRPNEGKATLAAYACFKAGESPVAEPISAVIAATVAKTNSGVYKFYHSYEHIYEAGVDAMLLADVDPDKYRIALGVIANYIQSKQRGDGSWSGTAEDDGDVSMSQYAVLGLWAAHRAGVQINPATLDRAAQWHLKSFNSDGGVTYKPGTTVGPSNGGSTPNMTAAALGTLAVVRLILFPQREKEPDEKLFGGVIEKVQKNAKPLPVTFPEYTRAIGRGNVENGIKRAFGYTASRFRPDMQQPGIHQHYYYYTLERAFALTNTQKVRDVDWYLTSGDYLAKKQMKDGSWDGQIASNSTSFVVLFYMRSTSRILGKNYGSGLLQAKRGLPKDLSDAFNPEDSEAEKKKVIDPLNKLLAALENADFGDLSDKDAEALAKKQQEIVEKIQKGDREELVGQVDRLKGLAKHPHPDVRRTALWALGRSGDMMMAPILIKALKDVDVDVMVEARNALCCVSRRANGFGLPSSPLEELEDATPEQRTSAAIAWSDKATEVWQKWWFRVRPYDLRDDLEEAALSAP